MTKKKGIYIERPNAFLRKRSAKKSSFICARVWQYYKFPAFSEHLFHIILLSVIAKLWLEYFKCEMPIPQSQFLNSLKKKNLGLVFISRVERVTLSKSSLNLCLEPIFFLNICKPVLYDHFMRALLKSIWVASTDSNTITSQQHALAAKANSNQGQNQ